MRERQADPTARPTVHPSGTRRRSAGSEGDAASGPAGIGAAPRVSAVLRGAGYGPPRPRQRALSTRRRRPRCRGEGWVAFGTSLRSRSCPSGRGRGSGPGRPRGSAVLQHLGQAGALRAAGALPCPLLPTAANPTGSTAT